ncbi:MAG: Gfo/Idh/MocA family protein [Actinomycetota bacterium]
MADEVEVGIIGGGLMGKEVAAAIARWPALQEHPVRPRLTAVCDVDPEVLPWFQRLDTVRLTTTRYRDVLQDDRVEILYIAVPHHLHEELYLAAIEAGRDFLGEKPFGIDLAAGQRIVEALRGRPDLFVRCSSEIPYFPGAQAAIETIRSGAVGRVVEAHSAFLHSSDLDPGKPINWKRQARFCGRIGVMGDLGMHALHVPYKLGWYPAEVFAVLQDLVAERPGPDGQPVPCDTIENATLHCAVDQGGGFPLTVETKRIAPGELNTWRLRVVGMEGGVEFSTAHPKTVLRFAVRDGSQVWERLETGSQSVFPTVTGGIFEFGFSDAVLQMWAAFLAERAGVLGDRFACVTPDEALAAHRLYEAALRSARSSRAEPVGPGG